MISTRRGRCDASAAPSGARLCWLGPSASGAGFSQPHGGRRGGRHLRFAPMEAAPQQTLVGDAVDAAVEAGAVPDLGPRAVTYPYRRIERPSRPPSDGPRPLRRPRPGARLARDRLARARPPDRDRGATELNYAEIGSGAADPVRARPWRLLAELPREPPPLRRRRPPRDRPRPARLRPQPDAPLEDHGARLRAPARPVLRRPRARLDVVLVGNSLGGFIAAEAAIAAPRLDRAARARLRRGDQPRDDRSGGRRWPAARMLNLLNPIALSSTSSGCGVPALRQALLRRRLPPPAADPARAALRVLRQRRRQARVPARRGAPDRLRHPRPARADRGPDAARLGPRRSRRARLRRPGLRRADPLTPSCTSSTTAGHVPMAERPVRFNRAARPLRRNRDGGAMSEPAARSRRSRSRRPRASRWIPSSDRGDCRAWPRRATATPRGGPLLRSRAPAGRGHADRRRGDRGRQRGRARAEPRGVAPQPPDPRHRPQRPRRPPLPGRRDRVPGRRAGRAVHLPRGPDAPGVLRALVHRGGLRAAIVSGGTIAVGDEIADARPGRRAARVRPHGELAALGAPGRLSR